MPRPSHTTVSTSSSRLESKSRKARMFLLRSFLVYIVIFLLLGYFIYTSNVDGQFQKAGFDPLRLVECHGSIHHYQLDEEIRSSIPLFPRY